MKKINFILLFSFLFSFYNFNSEDWVFISEPDIINSITEDSFYIYFLANNGIYSYDKMNEDFFYNIDLSYNLVDEETIDFTSMAPGPHWNLPTFSEGVPQAFESGPAGVLGDQTGIMGVNNNLMAGPIGNYAQQAVANQVLGQSYGTLDPFQQQQVDDAINTYGTTSLGTLRG